MIQRYLRSESAQTHSNQGAPHQARARATPTPRHPTTVPRFGSAAPLRLPTTFHEPSPTRLGPVPCTHRHTGGSDDPTMPEEATSVWKRGGVLFYPRPPRRTITSDGGRAPWHLFMGVVSVWMVKDVGCNQNQ